MYEQLQNHRLGTEITQGGTGRPEDQVSRKQGLQQRDSEFGNKTDRTF